MFTDSHLWTHDKILNDSVVANDRNNLDKMEKIEKSRTSVLLCQLLSPPRGALNL